MMKQIPFKQLFDRFYPTPEEQTEITEFIQKAVDNWYTWFVENRARGWGRKILKFFMMPKTELHKQFRAIIVEPSKDEKLKKNSYNTKLEMDINIRSLKQQNPDDTFRYETMNKFSTTDDNLIRITIPAAVGWKIKWIKTMIISQNETPNLYLMFT